jgi:hypothetical protein
MSDVGRRQSVTVSDPNSPIFYKFPKCSGYGPLINTDQTMAAAQPEGWKPPALLNLRINRWKQMNAPALTN